MAADLGQYLAGLERHRRLTGAGTSANRLPPLTRSSKQNLTILATCCTGSNSLCRSEEDGMIPEPEIHEESQEASFLPGALFGASLAGMKLPARR